MLAKRLLAARGLPVPEMVSPSQPAEADARYIVKSLIPIGFAIMLLQSLSEAIKSYTAMRRA